MVFWHGDKYIDSSDAVMQCSTVMHMRKMETAVSLRLPGPLTQRLDRVKDAMVRSTGLDVERSQVMRLLLERALPALEKEHGIKAESE